MEISATLVRDLRDKTGAPMMDCKKALQEVNGDINKAIDRLREKGLKSSLKKSTRTAKEGLIGSYVHLGSKIGVLLEVNCETDFVARTPEFNGLVKNLSMHIAASSPLYLTRDDVPQEVLAREKEICRNQALQAGKPEKVVEKIVEGKMDKFFAEVCLMEQSYVREPELTVKGLLDTHIGKIGENIVVRRFCRYQLGESAE